MPFTKIEYAVGAAGLFVQHLHRENFDRGMIATFGNSFQIQQGFTFYERNIHSSLGIIARSIRSERTRIYASIEDAIQAFWQTGSRDRPWLLTIITDGQDNESRRYRQNPVGIGQFIATRFNHEPSNYIFVIGVGKGFQVDRNALATMGNYGNFLAITIEAFPLLERVFLEIALQVPT